MHVRVSSPNYPSPHAVRGIPAQADTKHIAYHVTRAREERSEGAQHTAHLGPAISTCDNAVATVPGLQCGRWEK